MALRRRPLLAGGLALGLAAQGIACAHVQHMGSEYRVWLSGPLDWGLRQLRGEFGQRIDHGCIAAAGHSLGAHAIFNDAGPEDPVGAAAAALVQAFLHALWQRDARALPARRERQGACVTRFESQGDLHRIPSGVRT